MNVRPARFAQRRKTGVVLMVALSFCTAAISVAGCATRATSVPMQPTSTLNASAHSARHDKARGVRDSTVQLVQRPITFPDSDFWSWTPDCTAVKIQIDDRTYLLSAGHCFHLNTATVLTKVRASGEDPANALILHTPQLLPRSEMEFGIISRPAHGNRAGTVIPLDKIAVQFAPDVALAEAKTEAVDRTFAAIPALRYSASAIGTPKRGSNALLGGFPTLAGGVFVSASGTYLGRVRDPDSRASDLYLFGVNPARPGDDPCNYGASGSIAVFTDGYLTGPLAMRNNISNPRGTNGTDDPNTALPERDDFAAQTPLRVREYKTICGYGVIEPTVLSGLIRAITASR